MARKKPINELQSELREIFLSMGDDDGHRSCARGYGESARQSLDFFGDVAGALEDAREALRIAGECGEDTEEYRSLYFRILFRAEKFDEIVRLADEESSPGPETSLWCGMARFSMKGEFPVLSDDDLPLIDKGTLLEYAYLAYQSGFTQQALRAASQAKDFTRFVQCERLIAECHYDEGAYNEAASIYENLAMYDASNGAYFVRYADSMAMAGRYGAAADFLAENPPRDPMLGHLLMFNLCWLMDDLEGMKRALARIGLVHKGVLYYQQQTCYFRKKGAYTIASIAHGKARAYIPRRIGKAPLHEQVISLVLDCEEALLSGVPASAESLLPAIAQLPVTESLLYGRELSALARSRDDECDGVPWNPLHSPWLKAVVGLMLLLILFLIYLETKYGWLNP